MTWISCSDGSTTVEKTHPASTTKATNTSFSSEINFKVLDPSVTGFDFENKIVETPERNFFHYDYLYNGAGVALADFDKDGFVDIFMTGNDSPSAIFRNKGKMKFTNMSSTALPKDHRYSMGATIVDFNDDGYPDIYVCNSGPEKNKANRANQLLINNKDFTFTDKAAEYGLDISTNSVQAEFFDYDKDGDLDLWVNNHSDFNRIKSLKVPPGKDFWLYMLQSDEPILMDSKVKFFKNENGQYKDISREVGVDLVSFGLGLSVADFNEDGYLDVYVANDFMIPDFYFLNNGIGGFTEVSKSLDHTSYFSMGCDASDYDNDGILDFTVVDMTPKDHYRNKTLMESMNVTQFNMLTNKYKFTPQYMFNVLQHGNGLGFFSEIGNALGMSLTGWSWAPLFFDMNNDGHKDLYITNGYYRDTKNRDEEKKQFEMRQKLGSNYNNQVAFDLLNQIESNPIKNKIFKNTGDLKLEDVSSYSGNEKSFSNGAAYGDLDNDGDLDLVINNFNSKSWILENTNTDNTSFRVKLTGDKQSNYKNSQLILHTSAGIQRIDYSFQKGYLSHMEQVAHFGLSKGTTLDSLEITWADGSYSIIRDIEGKKNLELNFQQTNRMIKESSTDTYLFDDLTHFFSKSKFLHKEDIHNDFSKEVLLPQKYSSLGPPVATTDLDGDGADDIYVGGSKSYSGYFAALTPSELRTFPVPLLDEDKDYEDLGALFFDADGDGNKDLYIASGGGSEITNPSLLQDRLYIKEKEGFRRGKLPKITSSTKAIAALDYDNDGDLDLFVGGRNVPGKYPSKAQSYLLENNEGEFSDAMTPEFQSSLPNMVTDVEVADINGDKHPDLIISGEWSAPLFFTNDGKGVFNKVSYSNIDNLLGWWYSVSQGDVNGDGRPDFVFGNLGLNNKFHPSETNPLKVYFDDFDDSGTQDIVLAKNYKGKTVPVRGKECSSEQMPFLEAKFPTYHEFASSSIEQILGDKVKSCNYLTANYFNSTILLSSASGYTVKELPFPAQWAPILDSEVLDINDDGHLDIVAIGRIENTEPETPAYDGSRGIVLYGHGDGNFTAETRIEKTGLNFKGNAKNLEIMKGGNIFGLLVSNNNSIPQLYVKY